MKISPFKQWRYFHIVAGLEVERRRLRPPPEKPSVSHGLKRPNFLHGENLRLFPRPPFRFESKSFLQQYENTPI